MLLKGCVGEPSAIQYSTNDYDDRRVYMEGDEVVFTCIFDPELTASAICDSSGTWINAVLDCPTRKHT